ncbi:bcl-2-related ovarian killer protein-like isoform X1 [Copidosoma floridanum]|uniref:bcl-2-related ovarian killer protein-like isoform X1 n=1 Tax=Copidosoma floridanum TaxID=29053 RepID=UPI0006C9C6E2|nr:bcl-2-related ovarian killer protein-like isoform X1 [Copidosoma floridanum]
MEKTSFLPRRRRCTCCLEYQSSCRRRATPTSPGMSSASGVQLRLSSDEAATVTAAANAAKSYRRGSLAATLHFINLTTGHPDAFDVARRRLSNVGDVFSRKISRTIGWRPNSVSVENTVNQGSQLCAQYIRHRLKRSGIFQRKSGLKRMGSAKLLGSDMALVNEVQHDLSAVGAELEKLQPHLFEKIGRQIGCGSFDTEQRIVEALTDVAREVLRSGECTWSKVVALYAVAGGMAVDCVRQGKRDFLPVIQRAMTVVLQDDLAAWIQANGGWSAFAMRYRPATTNQMEWQINTMVLFIAATTLFVGIISVAIRLYLL